MLSAEFERLRAANDPTGLVALLPSISDTHPHAAQMLNCIGHTLGVTAVSFPELERSIRVLERAIPLAEDPLLLAKILINVAAFRTWAQWPGIVAVGHAVLAVPLPPEHSHIHGLALYFMAYSHAVDGDFLPAQAEFEAVLSYPPVPGLEQSVRIALASLRARTGDAAGVEAYLQYVRSEAFAPYLDGVRARLALTLGDPELACELARKAIMGFSESPLHFSTVPPMLSVRALYADALAARGHTVEAERVAGVLTLLNGGAAYTTKWGGI